MTGVVSGAGPDVREAVVAEFDRFEARVQNAAYWWSNNYVNLNGSLLTDLRETRTAVLAALDAASGDSADPADGLSEAFFVSAGAEQALTEAARTGRDINVAGALYRKVNHGAAAARQRPTQQAATDRVVEANGMALIRAERQRQIDVEGYSADHDAGHGDVTLVHAAGQYRSAGPEAWKHGPPRFWPWEASTWKPRDPISNLIRAGALYLAAADLGNPYGERNAQECADIIDACCARLALPRAAIAAARDGADT